MEKQKVRNGYLLLLPSIFLVGVFIVYPTLKTTVDSFFEIRTQTAVLGAKFIGFANYIRAFRDNHFLDTILWTMTFTFGSVVIELIIGMALALVMKIPGKGQGFIRTSILVPWALPTIVSGIIWTQFFSQNGFINFILTKFHILESPVTWLGGVATARFSILIADIWKTTPYMSLLLLAGLLTISKDYYEAAEIDGANKVYQFFYITVPLIRPTMMVTILFRIISALRVYDLIIAMTNGGPGGRTETVSMYAVNTYFTYGNIGYGATLSVLTMLISVGISFFFSDTLKSRV
jgi:multiple sugar transport system permease protein